MLNKPSKVSRNTPIQNNRTKSITLQTAQHGGLHQNHNSSFFPERGTPLLGVPGESLTHITSYLDVPTLLSLSRVNKSLHEHVNNDSTWYRALLCQFLGVSPESDLCGVQGITLRRTESSWRKELVYRHITSVYVSGSFISLHFSPVALFQPLGKISHFRDHLLPSHWSDQRHPPRIGELLARFIHTPRYRVPVKSPPRQSLPWPFRCHRYTQRAGNRKSERRVSSKRLHLSRFRRGEHRQNPLGFHSRRSGGNDCEQGRGSLSY